MINYVLTLLALLGLIDVFLIIKKKGKKRVCLIGETCDKVLMSSQNKMFGIPNEYLGALHYGFVFVASLIWMFWFQTVFGVSLEVLMRIEAAVAVLFSIYLVYLMWRVIKAWCEYCLTSALLSLLIFIVLLL